MKIIPTISVASACTMASKETKVIVSQHPQGLSLISKRKAVGSEVFHDFAFDVEVALRV
jgi:hypothetical protein